MVKPTRRLMLQLLPAHRYYRIGINLLAPLLIFLQNIDAAYLLHLVNHQLNLLWPDEKTIRKIHSGFQYCDMSFWFAAGKCLHHPNRPFFAKIR